MIAVADASPICYLILIGEIDLLPALFTEVLLPKAVLTELLDPGAPPQVREWAGILPGWVTVREVSAGGSAGLEHLQAGERAAIILYESARADLLLLDEKSARRTAAARCCNISGLLGILAEAAKRRLLDLPSAVDPNHKFPVLTSVAEGRPGPLHVRKSVVDAMFITLLACERATVPNRAMVGEPRRAESLPFAIVADFKTYPSAPEKPAPALRPWAAPRPAS